MSTGVRTIEEDPGAPAGEGRAGGLVRRSAARLRRHWLFVLLLGAGVALRALVQLTYEPAIFFYDSYTYLLHAVDPVADSSRPLGYPALLLRPLLAVHDLAVVPLVHHLLGLGMAAGIYAMLLRREVRHWLAAVATAPVLLDGYQLQIEQNIASDTFFLALVVGGLVMLTWRERPAPLFVATAGLLFGLAATVRFVGAPLIAVPLLCVLVGSRGRSRLVNVALLGAAAAVPLLVYATWTYNHTGDFRPGGNSMSARTLYARTAPLAECGALADAGVPAPVLRACPQGSPTERPQRPQPYMEQTQRPSWAVPGVPPGPEGYELLREFAVQVALHQPLDVTAAVLADFREGFAWTRGPTPDGWPLKTWWFDPRAFETRSAKFDVDHIIDRFGGEPFTVHAGPATFLRGYQSLVYTRGPMFALGAALAVAAGLGLGSARRSQLRGPALLVAGAGLGLLLSAAVYSFSWRYQLPAITLLPWAGALGLAAMVPAVRRNGTGRTGNLDRSPAQGQQPQDDCAVAGFRDRYGDRRFAPLVVVVAAYDESATIGAALDEVPRTVLGLDVDVVVVDDGSGDGAGDVATRHDAYVCRLGANRGQGAALRVGYRLAREGGARYVATTDADGQYDARELPVLLRPLVHDEADFVTGSRRLGQEERTDWLRHLGVRFFARVISVLVGTSVTDPANGFRAMKAEVTAAVTLREPQYQAAELLIGALAHGFRVVERPTTMRRRAAGRTKKGGNLLYGIRYARVVLGTWWRERAGLRAVPAAVTTGAGRPDPGR
jgi:hypothetical protein